MVGGSGLDAVIDAVREAADAGIRRGLAPPDLRRRGADRHRRRRPRDPRRRVRDGGGAHLSPPSPGAGRPGAHHLGRRRRRPPSSRHRALPPARDRGHARDGVREAGLHMREYLSALRPALDGQPVAVKGQTLQAQTLMGPLTVDDAAGPSRSSSPLWARPCCGWPGELADGTLTWMASPEVIGKRIAPRSRPPPRRPGGPGPGWASGSRWR